MDKFELAECVGQIDEKFIEEAQPRDKEQVTVRKRKAPWALIAACLCLVVALPMLIWGLKSNGTQQSTTPSSSEIIPSENEDVSGEKLLSFLVYHNDSEAGEAKEITGYQLSPFETPTPEVFLGPFEVGTYYDWKVSPDGTRRYGFRDYDDTFERSQICCYENEALLWESEPIDFSITNLTVLNSCIAVSGSHIYDGDTGTETDYYFELFDLNGQPLWKKKFPSDWTEEMAFIEHENGEISVFILKSCWEAAEDWEETEELVYNEDLCFYRYSASGELLCERVINQLQTSRILDAQCIDDGYLLVLDTQLHALGQTYIVFLNEDGSLRDYWRFENDTDDMRMTNALQVGDKLYVSGYLIHNKKQSYFGYEVDTLYHQICEQMEDQSWPETPDGTLAITEEARAYYTALLLEFDMESGEIITFYTTPCALGADVWLAEDGALYWQQENIGDTRITAMNQIIRGICENINYRFEDGCFTPERTQTYTDYYRWNY